MTQTEIQNASFWRRLLASFIDTFLFFFLNTLFWNFLAQSTSVPNLFSNFLIYLVVLLLSPIGSLYPILLPYYLGGTFGKLVSGIKIVSSDGTPLNFKRMLFRQTIGYMFSATFFGLGYLSVLKDPEKKAWHDKASGSKVIIFNKSFLSGVVMLVILIFGSGYMILQTIASISQNNPLQTDVRNLIREMQLESQNSQQVSSGEISQEILDQQNKVYELIQQQNYQQAQTAAESINTNAKSNLEKALALQISGEVFMHTQKLSEAKSAFEQALTLEANLPGAHYGIASVYLSEKQYEKARESAQKAVDIYPDYPQYIYLLGYTYYYLNDLDRAKYYFENALEKEPGNKNYQDALEMTKKPNP